MKGNLIIITSPSGGGKGTLIKAVIEAVPHIGYSVSYTTREPRKGEEEGRDYFFVSVEEFERLRGEGEFLESATVHSNFYGTSRTQVENITAAGYDVILEIDVQGAKEVLSKMPESVSIFIMPPSFEVLRARLTARATEKAMDLELRLRNSFTEVRDYSGFQYVVVNEQLEHATEELRSIILAERLRTNRQSDAISSILSNFDISKYNLIGDSTINGK
jgi:guanylate kinase